MLFAMTFLLCFVIGGLTGVLLANPPVDFAVHNSLFLVAHFHNMLIPGTLFAMIAGYMYWFPKVFGFRLDERWGTNRLVPVVGRVPARLHPALCARTDGGDAAERDVRPIRITSLT